MNKLLEHLIISCISIRFHILDLFLFTLSLECPFTLADQTTQSLPKKVSYHTELYATVHKFYNLHSKIP